MKITPINKDPGKQVILFDDYIIELDEDEKFSDKDIALLQDIIKVLQEAKLLGEKSHVNKKVLTRIASAMMTHFDIKSRIHLSSYLQWQKVADSNLKRDKPQRI